MGVLLIAAGVLCLSYYIFLQLLHMDFAVVWLGAALALAAFGVGNLWLGAHDVALPLVVKCFLCAVIAAGILLFAVAEGMIITGMSHEGEPDLAYIIVLGAQVRGDHPSRALQKRIEKAARYLQDNPETTAILSGGQGPGENITEAECMRQVLVKMGISSERLILEDKSTSTKENLMYSAELAPVKNGRIGLVTQNFHVYRSEKLAEHQGYKQVKGIAAPSEWLYQPHFMVREAFALIKEKIVGNI